MAQPLDPATIPLSAPDALGAGTGDLLFVSGGGSFGQVIRALTHSPWSHVAMLWRPEEVLVLESLESHGVRCVPLDAAYLGGGDPVVLARVTGTFDALAAAKLARSQLGKPYDVEEIAWIAGLILKDELFNHPRTADRPQGWICSELVAVAMNAGGVGVKTSHGYVTPADVWASDRVKVLGRVR